MNSFVDFFWIFVVIMGILLTLIIVGFWIKWLLKKAWEVIDRF